MNYGASDSPPRVLITGAGSGIGLACAEMLAACGAELILTDHDGTALTRVADRLGAFSRFCDAIADNSVAVFSAEIGGAYESIDVLINAAGQGYVRSLAMVRMTRALLPLLRRGHGRRLVVNIAPVGDQPSNVFPYASSNGAFERLSEALAEQTRGTAIDVVSLAPAVKRARPRSENCVSQLHDVDRVDEWITAARILDLITAVRPNWKHRAPPVDRRA